MSIFFGCVDMMCALTGGRGGMYFFNYTNPKSQRNSGLFCKFYTSRTCIHLNVSINIMPSYLSIASNISFNHQCLELEETTNFVEVGCLKKTYCIVIYL